MIIDEFLTVKNNTVAILVQLVIKELLLTKPVVIINSVQLVGYIETGFVLRLKLLH